ncbi:MAG TPA: DUF504 domain-containing protein [Candidatus Nitrosotalea sp.]|nr:DUF504 domain-containing protein [Candidatus Nitrosotalea sp.]
MARKGQVSEIFSKAVHHDNPKSYQIGYIDLGTTKEVTLEEFLNISENFEVIPASRIVYIRKENVVLYRKSVRDNISKIQFEK